MAKLRVILFASLFLMIMVFLSCSQGSDMENASQHKHAYKETILSSSTCEKNGEAIYECDCGHSYTEAISIKEHEYGLWSVKISPTMTSEGLLETVCQMNAFHTDVDVLPKLSVMNGYAYEIVTPATQTENGLGRYSYVKGTQTFTFDVVIEINTTEFDPR